MTIEEELQTLTLRWISTRANFKKCQKSLEFAEKQNNEAYKEMELCINRLVASKLEAMLRNPY